MPPWMRQIIHNLDEHAWGRRRIHMLDAHAVACIRVSYPVAAVVTALVITLNGLHSSCLPGRSGLTINGPSTPPDSIKMNFRSLGSIGSRESR